MMATCDLDKYVIYYCQTGNLSLMANVIVALQFFLTDSLTQFNL